MTLRQLNQIVGGTIIRGNKDIVIKGANYGKTRDVQRGHVYIFSNKISAVKQYDAVKKGRPAAVIVPAALRNISFPVETAVIQVKNTYRAFWRLGLWNFRQIPVKTVGVTGSAGKSTTTSMIAAILKTKFRVVHTAGNLNTASYLPSYLCRLSPGDHVLLLEMGMNSLGNIAQQCRFVRPNYGIVTNVGEAHYGSLGGTHNILRAKQELVDGVRPGGSLFLNADDIQSRKLKADSAKIKVFWFGIGQRADVRATDVRYTANGMSFRVKLNGTSYLMHIPTYGTHNVYNALAAIGVSHAMGVPPQLIKKGLSRFRQPKMRLEFVRGYRGRLLINDAWNANPTAMIAGLKVLKAVAGKRKKIAVLGDMLELGSYSTHAHGRVGEFIAQHPVDLLITVGHRAKTIGQKAIERGFDRRKVVAFHSLNSALHRLMKEPDNSVIYFKASRKMHFEKIVNALKRS